MCKMTENWLECELRNCDIPSWHDETRARLFVAAPLGNAILFSLLRMFFIRKELNINVVFIFDYNTFFFIKGSMVGGASNDGQFGNVQFANVQFPNVQFPNASTCPQTPRPVRKRLRPVCQHPRPVRKRFSRQRNKMWHIFRICLNISDNIFSTLIEPSSN